MKRSRLFSAALAIAALASLVPAGGAYSQDWPTRPVRLVVPFPPGISDLIARLLAQRLGAKFGQPFVRDRSKINPAAKSRRTAWGPRSGA